MSVTFGALIHSWSSLLSFHVVDVYHSRTYYILRSHWAEFAEYIYGAHNFQFTKINTALNDVSIVSKILQLFLSLITAISTWGSLAPLFVRVSWAFSWIYAAECHVGITYETFNLMGRRPEALTTLAWLWKICWNSEESPADTFTNSSCETTGPPPRTHGSVVSAYAKTKRPPRPVLRWLHFALSPLDGLVAVRRGGGDGLVGQIWTVA